MIRLRAERGQPASATAAARIAEPPAARPPAARSGGGPAPVGRASSYGAESAGKLSYDRPATNLHDRKSVVHSEPLRPPGHTVKFT